jgi:carboxypeptidase family protein
MRRSTRFIGFVSAALLCTASVQSSFTQEQKKEPAGSIAGRVTLQGKALQGVAVLITRAESYPQPALPVTATTDEDGRFRLTGLGAGSYNLVPRTPTLIVPSEGSFRQPGKAVTLAEGEQVEGLDFALTRGGVITGRITDADGRPIIEQRVSVFQLDERGQKVMPPFYTMLSFGTDDRGVYRIYGLTPGRYKVGVGDDSGTIRIGFGGARYTRTYYPDVTDESKASVVEVSAGGEASGIDIKIGGPSKSFMASGRVVDADSGKPLPDLLYGYGMLSADQKSIGGFGWTNNHTSSTGEFRLEGLSRGRFGAFVVSPQPTEFYSEPVIFEITDANISGLEIKVRRGASISGLVAVENTSDPEALAQLPKIALNAFQRTEELSAPSFGLTKVNPDGTFRITGLHPGKTQISVSYNGIPKGFTPLRLERDGVEITDGIDVAAGENVTGVRVLFAYGNCVLTGQVRVQGDQATPEMIFLIQVRKLDSKRPLKSTQPDARGRFTIEGLTAGDYEVVLTTLVVSPTTPGSPPSPGRVPKQPPVRQNVSLAEGAPTEITLVVDLSARDKDNDK